MADTVKSGITKAGAKNQPFVLLWKGAVIQLLVGQIGQDDVKKAKAALDEEGKGSIQEAQGKCSYDSEQKKIVFFSAKAPTVDTFKTKIKEYISKKASITLDKDNVILTRNKGDLLRPDEDGSPAAATDAPASGTEVPAAPPPPSPDEPVYRGRLEKLKPVYIKAVQAVPASKAKLDAMSKLAADAAKADNFAEALRLLDPWETALKDTLKSAVARPAAAVPPPPSPGKDGAVKEVSNVVFQQSRLLWDGTRKRVRAELERLKKAIVKMCEEINADPGSEIEVDMAELAGNVDEVDRVLEALDERLIDKLDEALNAKTPEKRKALHQEAKGIVQEYQKVLDGDPLLAQIDRNGFVNMEIRKTVGEVLKGLAGKL